MKQKLVYLFYFDRYEHYICGELQKKVCSSRRIFRTWIEQKWQKVEKSDFPSFRRYAQFMCQKMSRKTYFRLRLTDCISIF